MPKLASVDLMPLLMLRPVRTLGPDNQSACLETRGEEDVLDAEMVVSSVIDLYFFDIS